MSGESRGSCRRTCFICDSPDHFAKDCPTTPALAAMVSSLSSEVTQLPTAPTLGMELGKPAGSNKDTSQFGMNCLVRSPIPVISIGKHQDTKLTCGCSIPQNERYVKMEVNGCCTQTRIGQRPTVSAACGTPRGDKLPRVQGKVGNQVVPVLRDTGCDGVVVKTSLVQEHQFRMAHIDIDTPYLSGHVLAVCVDDPVCELIIGDVEGAKGPGKDKVTNQIASQSDVIINHKELVKEPTKIEEEREDPRQRYEPSGSSCETESHLAAPTSVPLLESGSSCETESHLAAPTSVPLLEVGRAAVVQTRGQLRAAKKAVVPLKVISPSGDVVVKEILITEQQKDKSLEKILNLSKSGEIKVSKFGSKHKYLVDQGIVVREVTSPQVNFGEAVRQMKFREHVLRLAHSSLFGGHL